MFFLYWFIATVVIVQISVLCTTIYLHRCITHQAVWLHPAVRFLMHLHITVFTSIVPREWAGVHRKHHYYSDQPEDPHSPYNQGLWKVFLLNWWYYRKETQDHATMLRFTPDYQDDLLDKLGSLTKWGSVVGLVIFIAMFGVVWGVAAFVFHIVTYILLNASINSFGHMVGDTSYPSKPNNLATNNRWLALFTGGEGNHRYHHDDPRSARFAMRASELDVAWPFIRTMQILGLAKIERVKNFEAAA